MKIKVDEFVFYSRTVKAKVITEYTYTTTPTPPPPPHTHTYTLSLFLSLSHTHTQTHVHVYTRAHTPYMFTPSSPPPPPAPACTHTHTRAHTLSRAQATHPAPETAMPVAKPSCRQTTVASTSFQSRSQTVPHWFGPVTYTSTRPIPLPSPPASRTDVIAGTQPFWKGYRMGQSVLCKTNDTSILSLLMGIGIA